MSPQSGARDPMPRPASQSGGSEQVVDLTGNTVGRFLIRSRLGAGGMGEVYRADDTRLKRPVALKRVAPHLKGDASYRQRLLREAQCASSLSYEHIAGVYDVLEEEGEMFVVMEYVEGTTLRQRLSQPVSIEQVLKMAVQCAMALVAAHERGVVHRDIKPENIMLTPTGHVKILDFGVAKQQPRADEGTTSDALSSTGGVSGTPAYMAPEVLLENPSDPRADIFSLGVVLHEALTGRHPFRADSFLATSDRVLHEVPAPLRQSNPKAPAELERIVGKMLAKDPAERYATAADLLVDLRAVQRTVAGPAPQLRPVLPEGRGLAKQLGWAGAVAAALVASLLAVPQVRQKLPWWPPAAPAGPKNLVVLPFRAIGGGPENQVFSDGLTETLTAKLTQLTAAHALQVTPAREVRVRRVSTAEEARDELGAHLVLEGTLYRSGEDVRVNCVLVDTARVRQLGGETITAAASNPFAVQDSVSAAAVRLLELELQPQERRALAAHGTQVASAYASYLEGRGYLQNYDKPENVENAITVFERALRLDPSYALAHAGLGDAYWKKFETTKENRWVDASRQACDRAAALDANVAAAHICLGTLFDGTGQSERAVLEFQRALETEPTSDDAYRGLALAYDHLGKFTESEATFRQAIALRPQYWAGYSWLGRFYFGRGRFSDAAEMFRQVVALVPESFRGYYNLGAVYVEQARYADAIGVLERSVAIRPSAGAYSNLGTAYFYQGRFEEAARTYEQAIALGEHNYVIWGNLGDTHSWIPGRKPDAARAYEKAISLAREKLQVNPRDLGLLGSLAAYYAMLGKQPEAMAYLRKALKLSPGDPALQFQAALVYNEFGQTDPALESLERAVALGYSPVKVSHTPNFKRLRSYPRFQKLSGGN